MTARAARLGAGMLAVASLLIATPASAVTAGPPARVSFDSDDFSLSSSNGSASGTVRWSRGHTRVVTGRVTGALRSSSGCARLQVSWLNSANSTLSRSRSSVCDGSTGFGLGFSSPNLQCVLIRLGSSTRQLCAGGS